MRQVDQVVATCAGMRGWFRHLVVAALVMAMLVGGSLSVAGATTVPTYLHHPSSTGLTTYWE